VARDNHEALYNNLQPGDYTFMVRARGNNLAWKTEDAVFAFTIKTPFHKSKWFFIGMALLISGMLFFIYRYRLAQQQKMMSLENKAGALEKEKAMVMYENLKQQLNPHFLFNSLTSLNSLIAAEPKRAGEFLDNLSKTYRYILKSRDNETVPLIDEIRFAESYIQLQKTRFEKGFDVKIEVPEEYHHRKIVPVTLQNLIENAIKHNIIDADRPLAVTIHVEDDSLVVENNLQKKKFVETSNRQGLASMQSLYNYLSSRPVEITETADSFKIKLPLL
jgi:LytS/YehU family sensor histidine kinase